jgi:hypothetical protein
MCRYTNRMPVQALWSGSECVVSDGIGGAYRYRCRGVEGTGQAAISKREKSHSIELMPSHSETLSGYYGLVYALLQIYTQSIVASVETFEVLVCFP